MVAALEKNIPLNTKIYAPQQYRSKFLGGSSDGAAACGNSYCPRNASPSMTGTQTMWSAFGESVNTYFVQLEQLTGVPAAAEAAQKLGVVLRGSQDQDNLEIAQKNDRFWGPFTLGVPLVSPLDMANAYATVAARGKHCDPLPIQKVTDSSGKELPFGKPNCQQVIPQDVADAATDAARCPVGQKAAGPCTTGHGGATAPSVGHTITRDIAGKTGTTDNNNAAWFVGIYTQSGGRLVQSKP